MMFEDKFVAFIDVLGFKSMVAKSEKGTGITLVELLDVLKNLGDGSERTRFEEVGPTCCPMAPRIEKNINFRVTQISDCAIVSSEVSPAGIINLVLHCWGAVIKLMTLGIMCRGYIRRGSIYHTNTQVIGSGYQEAYLSEPHVNAFKFEADERGTPYVEIDSEVVTYIESQSDTCVKEMFWRMAKRDGENTVLFPFQRLQHSFIVSGYGSKFDPAKELASNDMLRKNISRYKQVIESLIDSDDVKAKAKSRHYIRALSDQLRACDETDAAIRMLSEPVFKTERSI